VILKEEDMYKQKDIVLVPFPFTDLSGEKVRPALVIGSGISDDVTLSFVSSIISKNLLKNEVFIKIKEKDKTGLKTNSLIKVLKIATLENKIILGKIGELDEDNFRLVKQIIKKYFNL